MNEQTIHWLDIGKVHDIPVQGARRVHMDDLVIAVFRTTANEVYALEDRCPHANGPLSDGIVHGDCVTCPLHGWDISLRDGTAQGADQGKVRRFEIRQEGERLLLAQSIHSVNRQPLTADV